MSKVRVFPPVKVAYQTIRVNGREYTGQPGEYLDVLASDGDVLVASGWTFIANVGRTSERPPKAMAGNQYFDTNVGAIIVHDGEHWRNPATADIV